MINYFNSFKKNAFRVETLQRYNVDEEQEAFQYFQKNKKLPEWFWEDWCDIIKQAKTRWATMQRVHLIQVPISQYLSFELEEYKNNIKAWEEIYYIPTNECSIKIESDFWIFDDTTILGMYYDNNGKFIDFKKIEDNIDTYLQIKKYLLEHKRKIEELF